MVVMREKETPLADPGSFEEAAVRSLGGLRNAFAELIAAVPGDISKAADLHRALKIDMKLCWKVFKVATASNPLAAGPHVPGPVNMNAFLKAAAKRGVPAGFIHAAEDAAADFDRLVVAHAGDRATFDSMISAFASAEDAGQITLHNKRSAFRGNRHIWGVEAKTHLKCCLLQPAVDPRMVDIALIEGFVKLRQLRQDAPLIVSRVGTYDDDGTVRRVNREPVDRDGETPHGIALLREFCSKPLPQFRSVDASAGFIHTELVSNGLGNRGAITCFESHVTRSAVPRYRDENNRFGAYCVSVHMPCEVLILDVLAPDGTFAASAPVVEVCGERPNEAATPAQPKRRDRLPLHESVVYLGKGPSVLHTPDVPRYAEMARYAFDRLGWDGERFDVYRCRMEYPIMPSTVGVRFELPEGTES